MNSFALRHPGALSRSLRLLLVLGALVPGCEDHRFPEPKAPAILSRISSDNQSAPVGSPVATPPAVMVADAGKNPVAGVVVTFAVASGGGSVAGAVDTSDAYGIARVGSWILGPAMGSNTLTASSVEGLAPVTFTAIATAGSDWLATKQAGDSQTTVVATAVAALPAVLVRNGRGDPIPGVPVAFEVASGGGTITGKAATTDSAGIAAVGGWTLGARSGPNTLTATVAGLPFLTFTATGAAGPAAVVSKQAGDLVTGTVGSAVSPPPAVSVIDSYGNGVPGVSVSFVVASGGGSIVGGTVTTSGAGIAAVGSWVLGTAPGSNTLTATAGSLPPVTFTASGRAGPAASLTKQTGDNQSAAVGSAVPMPPSVLVKDVYGNPVSGATVRFSVLSGGGSLTGATPSTDAAGTAKVGGWTLGDTAGTNTVAASVTGLPAVMFTATGVDPCVTLGPAPYAIGSTVAGTLSTADCRMANRYTDLYATSLASTSSASFTMSSNKFFVFVSLFDGNGALVASASDGCDWYYYYCDPSNSNAGFRVLLAPGSYVVSASSADWNVTGGYSLSSIVMAEDVTGCAPVWVTAGLTTSQHIDPSDCVATFRSTHYYSDQFSIYLTAGRTYTLSMSSTAFDTYLELWGPQGIAASNDDFGGTSNSQITFTPTQSGVYLINAATYVANATGAYTLVIR